MDDTALSDLLSELMEVQFPFLLEGRQEVYFAKNPLVARLTYAIQNTESHPVLENFLNTLFTDLRTGEHFEHMEVVMALAFAMRGMDLFQELAKALSQSEVAELSSLRRFARRLLKKMALTDG